MPLPPLAEVADLDAWLPGVTIVGDDAAETRAEAVIAAASAYIRADRGQTWTDSEDALVADIPDEIPVIVVQIAARMWANPTGTIQEAAGPFSTTHGPSTLTDEERDLLTDNTAGGLGSIQVYAPPATRFTSFSAISELVEDDE